MKFGLLAGYAVSDLVVHPSFVVVPHSSTVIQSFQLFLVQIVERISVNKYIMRNEKVKSDICMKESYDFFLWKRKKILFWESFHVQALNNAKKKHRINTKWNGYEDDFGKESLPKCICNRFNLVVKMNNLLNNWLERPTGNDLNAKLSR